MSIFLLALVVGLIALMAYYVWTHPDLLKGSSSTTATNAPPAPSGPATDHGRKLGCYKDTSVRAMISPGAFGETPIEPAMCAAAAKAVGHKYIGLQAPNAGKSQCFTSNNWADVTRYGVAASCPDEGGPWINAVYDVTA